MDEQLIREYIRNQEDEEKREEQLTLGGLQPLRWELRSIAITVGKATLVRRQINEVFGDDRAALLTGRPQLNKARRAELVCHLLVGLTYDAEFRVVLDPDRQVQQAVRPVIGTVQVHRLQKSLGTWVTVLATGRWPDALEGDVTHGPEV